MVKVKDLLEKYGNREIDEVELLKILKPVKKTIYNLKKEDIYYSITVNGNIDKVIWDNDTFDSKRLFLGNVFLTREDAEFEIEYRKIKAELKRYASMCEEPIDWRNVHQCKFYCVTAFDMIHLFSTTSSIGDNIYFTDKSILEQAIKEIGEERIKKYYLGVKGGNKQC